MKNQAYLLLLLAVGLGAVSAGMTTAMLTREGGDSNSLAPVPATGLDPQLQARLRRLTEENQELRLRVETLELKEVSTTRAPVGGLVSAADFEAFRTQVLRSLAQREEPVLPPAELKGQVAEALQTLRKEEAVAAVRKGSEARAADREQRVAQVSEWLGLDAYQTQEMRSILTDRDERELELIRLWEESADTQVLGEMKRADADGFEADLVRILSPQQLDTYRARSGEKGKQ